MGQAHETLQSSCALLALVLNGQPVEVGTTVNVIFSLSPF
jgi:hypothetical protein